MDWNGTRLLRKSGDPTGAKSAEEAPGPPAESECLEWKSTFKVYKPRKKVKNMKDNLVFF
ncbi:UNVERIFIED_CONTAM: hypothetical protein FO527_21520 [Bacillus sp. ATCC 13368]